MDFCHTASGQPPVIIVSQYPYVFTICPFDNSNFVRWFSRFKMNRMSHDSRIEASEKAADAANPMV